MTTSSSTTSESARHAWEVFLTTLTVLGSTWAAHGLKIGKIALEHSAEALGKTAHTLDALAADLEKRVASHGSRADVVVDADAPGHDAAVPQA